MRPTVAFIMPAILAAKVAVIAKNLINNPWLRLGCTVREAKRIRATEWYVHLTTMHSSSIRREIKNIMYKQTRAVQKKRHRMLCRDIAFAPVHPKGREM